MICKICGDNIATGPVICPACAAALTDYVDKKTGAKGEIRGKVVEALKMALDDLREWHDCLVFPEDQDVQGKCTGCHTCQTIIPAVREALELLEVRE